jgi:isoaspartyl peptidase/L-asparaginase-like protein (Ntn-hydrolase superfamily)
MCKHRYIKVKLIKVGLKNRDLITIERKDNMPWSIIATWGFSLSGVEAASEILESGGSAIDAAEKVARMVEDDVEVDSVGYGGFPNIKGEVELDAAFMDGRDLSIGAVMAIKGFGNPISIAREVMTAPSYNLLADRGAESFAAKEGFHKKDMLTENMKKVWKEKKAELGTGNLGDQGHDTVGIVALDLSGDMSAATSTSGLSLKLEGRVGDSPIPGSGFYVDNEVGGAAATGVGEDIMKGCISFHAVELMRQGYTPQQAAEEAIKRLHNRLGKSGRKVGKMAIVCADNKGNFGGAANHDEFKYAACIDTMPPKLFEVKSVEGL